MLGKMIAYGVVILLALAAVVGAGAWLASRHYQPTIDRLNEVLTQCRDTGRQQAATITSQNAGIEELRRADAEREAKAKSAQEKAGREAQGDYSRANEVLSERTTLLTGSSTWQSVSSFASKNPAPAWSTHILLDINSSGLGVGEYYIDAYGFWGI